MGIFSSVLLYADYDHTLTGLDGRVPQRNLAAIRYFMDEGGRFAVASGRSLTMCGAFRDIVPCNAPLILFNGALAYDMENRRTIFCREIPLEPEKALRMTIERFPENVVELQGLEAHYAFGDYPVWRAFGRRNRACFRQISFSEIPKPFVKFSMAGAYVDDTVTQFYSGTPEQLAAFDQAEAWLRETFGQVCVVDRAAPRILDLQVKGTSKGAAAREMKAYLKAKKLICVGDGLNDLSMLDAADLAFVPGDANPTLRERFHTVCPCGQGAVADVINCLPDFL